MILDSSAIVTIAFKEPDYRIMLSKLQEAGKLAIGAPTLVETAIVLSARLQNDARGLLTHLLNEAKIITLPLEMRTIRPLFKLGVNTVKGGTQLL